MYHIRARIIGRKGKRISVAVRAAAYRSRSLLYDDVAGQWVNYSYKQDLSVAFIIAPPGSPAWVFDREKLWNEAEKYEKRVDSQVCRELEISLPRAFGKDRSVRVISDFITKNCVELGMIADISIHGIGGNNPHAHVLLTMRRLDLDANWGKKATEWNQRSMIHRWRKNWENTLNDEFVEMGMPEMKVSCESYKTRGIDKNPQKYCGQRRMRLWREEEIIEPKSAQYVIDQLKKEDEELQRQIDFYSLLSRRKNRCAGQMLSESLSAFGAARLTGVQKGEIRMDGLSGRLAANEKMGGLEPKNAGTGMAPGPGFG